MRNIDWLYQTNNMFRETVNQGAAQWMGSDSPVFAGEWLLGEHEPEQSDYEDLRGQHLDDGPCVVPNREELVDRITDMVNAKMEERDTGELIAFVKRLESAAENGDDVTLFGVDYVPAANAEYLDGWDSSSVADLLHQYEDGKLMRDCDMETHVLIETEAMWKLAEKYRAGSVAAQEEAEAWRAKCGELLDAAHEMVRIGGDVA